jgi:methionyl-tRNA formyltransferase
MLKIAILAPIDNSLYARLVLNELLAENEVQVCAVVVRSPFNFSRMIQEYNRDGFRLLKKVVQKMFVGDQRYRQLSSPNLTKLAEVSGLKYRTLNELCKANGIPHRVVPDLNTCNSVDFMKKSAPDVIVFTGGGLIRQDLLATPSIGILNCHTGLLPRFRGMDVVEWTAVENEVESTGFGITLHFIDKGIDTGPILLHKRLAKIPDDYDFQVIRAVLETYMVELMVEGVKGLASGKLSPIPQSKDSGRQYYVMHPRIKEYAVKKLVETR